MGAKVPPIPPSVFMRTELNGNGWERMGTDGTYTLKIGLKN